MKILLTTFVLFALVLQPLTSVAQDPLEALAEAKKERPWFGRFMSGDPVVAGLPGESEEDRLKRMQKWSDAKLGLFLHWGPQRAGGEYVIKPAVLDQFNPVKFDAEEWVLDAKKIGFRYIVITAKHHAGFCMFDSKHTDHDIIDATPFGRDPLKELAEACKKHDMLLGFYYSVWDIRHPNYSAKIGSPDYAIYHQYMLEQTEELLTNYGDVVTLWMDGEWVNSWTYERATEYRDAVRKHQPNIALVDRIGQRRLGDGDYASCENFTPYVGDNLNGRVWESCQRFDGGWFWQGKDTSKSVQWALANLVDTVSRGGNLLLNVGPSPTGNLPPNSVAKLQPLGVWLAQYGESIYGVQRGPHYLIDWGSCTRRDNTLYYHVAHWPKNGTLRIPGLNPGQPNANIREVLLMGETARPLEFNQDGSDVVVSVPEKSVDPLMSVIKVELNGAPVVDNAIRPLTRGLRPQKGNAKVKVGDYFLSSGFAKLHGTELHYSLGAGAGGQRENLKGWTNVDDWAQWEILADRPGTYDVIVNHSSWMKGGKFVVEVAGKSFEHEVVATGKVKGRKSPFAAAFKRVTVGRITLDQPGRYKVSLKALAIDPKAIEYDQGLMLMREVILSAE